MRVVYKNVSYRSYEHIILNYRTAAHTLNDTAGFLQQLIIGNGNNHTLVIRRGGF